MYVQRRIPKKLKRIKAVKKGNTKLGQQEFYV